MISVVAFHILHLILLLYFIFATIYVEKNYSFKWIVPNGIKIFIAVEETSEYSE